MGEKTQKKIIDIVFNQVQCKTQTIRLIRPQESSWTASSLPDGLLFLSLVQLLSYAACPNEGGASHIYSD